MGCIAIPRKAMGKIRGRVSQRTRIFEQSAFAGLVLLATLPLWLTEHPPIQDWPQHLAAIRVMHSFSDPAFGFQSYFVLEPSQTQYLSVYFVAHLLSFLVGVPAAAKCVLGAAIVGLPYGIRALARAVDRSPWVGLLAVPLSYSTHHILGFLNFVAALPLMFWALALAVRASRSSSQWANWLCAAVLALCFYTHIIPFAFAFLGVALVSLQRPWASMRRWLLPLASVALAATPWLIGSPAAHSLAQLFRMKAGGGKPAYDSFSVALKGLSRWLIDIWRDDWDYWLLMWWLLALAIWALAGLIQPRSLRKSEATEASAVPSQAPRLALLPVLAALGYFVCPSSYDWIWPINGRFPLLALLLAIPLLRPGRLSVQIGVQLGNAVIVLVMVVHVSLSFLRFERDEALGLQDAMAQIPPRQRVAGLMFEPGSRVVEFAPFLHSVAYYQQARGGAVMFTFADFPQSIFRFRDDNRPPRVPPRWEWLAYRVDPDRDLSWYDWILARGQGGALSASHVFERIYSSHAWSVWRRRGMIVVKRSPEGNERQTH